MPGDRPRPHPLDRYVIDYAVAVLETNGQVIRAVRGVFAEGRPLYPNSYLFDRQHIQIAVRDQSIVEEITLDTPTGTIR